MFTNEVCTRKHRLYWCWRNRISLKYKVTGLWEGIAPDLSIFSTNYLMGIDFALFEQCILEGGYQL